MGKETHGKTKGAAGRFTVAILGFVLVNAIAFTAAFLTGTPIEGSSIERDVRASNLGQSSLYGTWSWWTAHGYFEGERRPDVVVMGSSLMNSAAWAADALTLARPVDCALHHRVYTFERELEKKTGARDVKVVNCSIGGAIASDYYMMVRALLTERRKPELLVLGIAPRDFIDNKLESPNTTEPFMFFNRYVPIDAVVAHAFNSPWERAMGELEGRLSRLPLRSFHAKAANLLDEKRDLSATAGAGNALLSALSAGILNVKPGDLVVPCTQSDTWFDNTAEYRFRYKNPYPKCYKTEMYFFEETLKELKNKGVNVLVVEMPTLPVNRELLPDRFWKDHLGEIAAICRRHGAGFTDFSHSSDFVKKDFVDTVHVNWHGGKKVFERLAGELKARPQLASRLSFGGRLLGAKEAASSH